MMKKLFHRKKTGSEEGRSCRVSGDQQPCGGLSSLLTCDSCTGEVQRPPSSTVGGGTSISPRGTGTSGTGTSQTSRPTSAGTSGKTGQSSTIPENSAVNSSTQSTGARQTLADGTTAPATGSTSEALTGAETGTGAGTSSGATTGATALVSLFVIPKLLRLLRSGLDVWANIKSATLDPALQAPRGLWSPTQTASASATHPPSCQT